MVLKLYINCDIHPIILKIKYALNSFFRKKWLVVTMYGYPLKPKTIMERFKKQ